MLCLQGLNVDEPNVDGLAEGYIEGSVTRSKTSYTVERKTRLLPMVCPRLGVTGVDWFNGWRGACIEADKPKGPGVPMLPAPSVHGWNRVPLRASEGGDWLRKILMAAGHSRDSLSNIGTHSLKATGLSWCAKFGLGHDIRRHLGYHVAKGDHSLLVYSRDAVAQPVREFDRVLRSIRSGCFRPDMTRSGFFRPAVHPEGRAAESSNEPRPRELDPDSDSASSSEDSMDEDDRDQDMEGEEEAQEHVLDPWCEFETHSGEQSDACRNNRLVMSTSLQMRLTSYDVEEP